MTFGLVDVGYSLPEGQAVKLIFFAPCKAKKTSFDLSGNRTHDLRIRSPVTLPTELQGRTRRKSGTILDGESRRRERVHMNVVPRSTGNTNSGTEN